MTINIRFQWIINKASKYKRYDETNGLYKAVRKFK